MALDDLLFDLVVRKAPYLDHPDVEGLLPDLFMIDLASRLDGIFVPDDDSRRVETLGTFLIATLLKLDPQTKCNMITQLYPCERLSTQDLQDCARLGIPVCHSAENPPAGFHVGQWNVREQVVTQIGESRGYYEMEIPEDYFKREDTPLVPLHTSGEVEAHVHSRSKRGISSRPGSIRGLYTASGKLSIPNLMAARTHLMSTTPKLPPVPKTLFPKGVQSAASFPKGTPTLMRVGSLSSLDDALLPPLSKAGASGGAIQLRRMASMQKIDKADLSTPTKTGGAKLNSPSELNLAGVRKSLSEKPDTALQLQSPDDLLVSTSQQGRYMNIPSRASSVDSPTRTLGKSIDNFVKRVHRSLLRRYFKRLTQKYLPSQVQQEQESRKRFQLADWYASTPVLVLHPSKQSLTR